jgi:hypothetical protein
MLRLIVWVAKSGDLQIEMAGMPVDGSDEDDSSTMERTSTFAPTAVR